MSSWSAIYLRGELPEGYRPAVVGPCPVRRVGAWLELAMPGVEAGEASCRELSQLTPEPVIWVLLQTTASVLVVAHYVNGQPRRYLESGDGAWRRCDGEPQPWETWLFSDEELERARDVCDPESDATVAAIFARKTIEVGDYWPSPNEWDALFQVIGVPEKAWRAAQALPPRVVLQGRKRSKLTLVARLFLAATLASVAAWLIGSGSGWGAFAVVSGVVAAASGYLRRAVLGAWFW